MAFTDFTDDHLIHFRADLHTIQDRSARELGVLCAKKIKEKSRPLQLDLSSVAYVDSSFMNILLKLVECLGRERREVIVRYRNDELKSLFIMFHLDLFVTLRGPEPSQSGF